MSVAQIQLALPVSTKFLSTLDHFVHSSLVNERKHNSLLSKAIVVITKAAAITALPFIYVISTLERIALVFFDCFAWHTQASKVSFHTYRHMCCIKSLEYVWHILFRSTTENHISAYDKAHVLLAQANLFENRNSSWYSGLSIMDRKQSDRTIFLGHLQAMAQATTSMDLHSNVKESLKTAFLCLYQREISRKNLDSISLDYSEEIKKIDKILLLAERTATWITEKKFSDERINFIIDQLKAWSSDLSIEHAAVYILLEEQDFSLENFVLWLEDKVAFRARDGGHALL